MPTQQTTALRLKLAAIAALLSLPGALRAADLSAASAPNATRPDWLTDLSLGVSEAYDDNVLLVSGLGLPAEASWSTDVSFKLGVNLAPELGAGPAIKTLSLVYQPDVIRYATASTENYTAHRLNEALAGTLGSFSYNLTNAFLYDDGSKLAETYALNQLSGSAANQADKYRNSLAHAAPRERRNQIQDRHSGQLRWDSAHVFFRPVSSVTYYNLNTYLFNTSKAPYLGYQDYIDRWDANGGADFGYKVTPDFALTVGYRDGYQHQDPFSTGINSDFHHSSNHYQRLLFGFEGKLGHWLSVSASAGPDYRRFNPDTPITDLHTTRFYGETQATATLSRNQTLTLAARQWIFVSSTGLVPYQETTASLVYHWKATQKLGLDLGEKIQKHNYTISDDLAGSAPSLREDIDYQSSVAVSYAIVPHLAGTVGYTFEKGLNDISGLPAAYDPAYRDFEHGVVTIGLKYAY